jgi:hypothetical protein
MAKVDDFEITKDWGVFKILRNRLDRMLMVPDRWRSLEILDEKYRREWKKHRATESGSQTSGDSSDSKHLLLGGGGLNDYIHEGFESDHKEFGRIRAVPNQRHEKLYSGGKFNNIEGPDTKMSPEEVFNRCRAAASPTPAPAEPTGDVRMSGLEDRAPRFTTVNPTTPVTSTTGQESGYGVIRARKATGQPSESESPRPNWATQSSARRSYATIAYPESPAVQSTYHPTYSYMPHATESAQRDTVNMQPHQPASDIPMYSPPQQNAPWMTPQSRQDYYQPFIEPMGFNDICGYTDFHLGSAQAPYNNNNNNNNNSNNNNWNYTYQNEN